jgi:collagenase-like PrtC family protease
MQVKFHLPDFASQFKFNLVFATMLKNCPQYFREGVEIASIYGTFPQSLWNGGRTVPGMCNTDFAGAVIRTFNKNGIPLRFTFTNPMIEEKHLSDKFCNDIMKIANNGMNEVIVNSPLLEDYIRKTYPDYKLTSSTCKRITEPDRLLEEMEKDYSIVVLDYDFNNKFDILEKLPHKERMEILVNACCDPACPRRTEHYRILGMQQIALCEHLSKNTKERFNLRDYGVPDMTCKCADRTIFDIKGLSTHISPDAIWKKYVPMGFSQFKIEGRTTTRLNMLETYLHYMIKPEHKDEVRFMLLYNLEKNGVIRIEGNN